MAGFGVMVLAASLSGCESMFKESASEVETQTAQINCVAGCTCTGCICCGTVQEGSLSANTVEESSLSANAEQEGETQEERSSENSTEEEASSEKTSGEKTSNVEEQSVEETQYVAINTLSEGELLARKQQQANFNEARKLCFSMNNSVEKTVKINEMDKQILANNAYDFSQNNIVFIGDSITEGLMGAVDADGNKISYVNYADSYLHFNRTLNHGKGGRMFSQYSDNELSLAANFGNVTNIDSDIIVVFAGINDYLSTPANKRYGNINDIYSTAGYCGAVRSFMKQLTEYYSNRQIFFVTMYNLPKKVQCTYSDIQTQPTLQDYLQVQRQLAAEYGFHIIELYDIGFMDCTNKETAGKYLADGLHPNDEGNRILGEHIAAELSLYFSQKK